MKCKWAGQDVVRPQPAADLNSSTSEKPAGMHAAGNTGQWQNAEACPARRLASMHARMQGVVAKVHQKVATRKKWRA